ncbi:MAG TPA: NUDIX domain-containing protein [Blastocatellia bacterium]|nr:NUDIX domain-containing protein [Blastocatellia bacterium]
MIPVVVALILKNGAVLMCQRPETKIYGLHWEFPGGKVEPGETRAEALVRELREELGIEAEIGEEYFKEIASYSNGMTYDITYFIVRHFKNEPVNKEFASIGWIDRSLLPTLQHLSGNDRILKQFYEQGIPT